MGFVSGGDSWVYLRVESHADKPAYNRRKLATSLATLLGFLSLALRCLPPVSSLLLAVAETSVADVSAPFTGLIN